MMEMKTLDLIILIQVVMEYLWFVLTHRSTLYVSWLCPNLSHFSAYIHSVFWVAMPFSHWHGSTVYIWWPWLILHFVIWVWECLPQKMVYYYAYAWLFAGTRPMCSLFSTYTFYKVFQLSHVPTSYFGGNYVTHYFGHPLIIDDMCTSYFYVP